MPMGCYNKRPEETSDDFFVRIGNAVLARELTWDGASKVLNDELGKNFGECAYRKRFKAFRAGMQYQESLSNRDVGTCILSISDLHIPFQKPIETFSEYAGKIDILYGSCRRFCEALHNLALRWGHQSQSHFPQQFCNRRCTPAAS